MGKIRTRTIGIEEVENKQKKAQKLRAEEKKLKKGKTEKVTEEKEEKKPVQVKEEKAAAKAKKKATVARTRGKRYVEVKKLVDRSKLYSLKEAVKLIEKMKSAKFDESVELHLNVDEKGLKGEVELPHSTGKTIKITIVDDKVLSDIERGKIDFDVLVTHPSYMPKLARFAKILGPKGLMPNPKAGTISPNPEEVAKKYSKGGLRWKTEAKFPLVHQMIGKISAGEKPLTENAEKFLDSVGINHIKSAFIKSTMSPSVKLDPQKL